jgi:hypothetical protein
MTLTKFGAKRHFPSITPTKQKLAIFKEGSI